MPDVNMPKLSDTTPRQCPCHSGHRYAACCRPMHRAEREAPTPEALMRSRYAAYSLGLGDYLVNTLAEAHPDRAVPREQLARSLSRARQAQRFLDLRILHTSTAADRGEVLFHARIFERPVRVCRQFRAGVNSLNPDSHFPLL